MTSLAYRRGGEPVSGPGEGRDGGVGADEGRGQKDTSTAILHRPVDPTRPVPAPSSTNGFSDQRRHRARRQAYVYR